MARSLRSAPQHALSLLILVMIPAESSVWNVHQQGLASVVGSGASVNRDSALERLELVTSKPEAPRSQSRLRSGKRGMPKRLLPWGSNCNSQFVTHPHQLRLRGFGEAVGLEDGEVWEDDIPADQTCFSVVQNSSRSARDTGGTNGVGIGDPGGGLRRLEDHIWAVKTLFVARGGLDGADVLVSGDGRGVIRVWDMQTFKCVRTLEGHREGVACLASLPESSTLFSGGYDNDIWRWDLQSGKGKRAIRGVGAMSASLDWRVTPAMCLLTCYAMPAFNTAYVARGLRPWS